MNRIFKNEVQKKWAMTGVLMAALGFSLSAPIQRELSMLDLASMDPNNIKTGEIADKNGKKHTVVFIKDGDNTKVLVPYELEGRVCETKDCINARVLKKSFSEDISTLKDMLHAQMRDDQRGNIPSKDKEKDADDKASLARQGLEKALERCDRKEGNSQASCLSREFLRGVKARKNQLTSEDAHSIFRDMVLPALRRVGRDYSDGNTSHEEFADMLRDLEAGLPSKYSRVRDDLGRLAKEVIAGHAAKIRKDRETALQRVRQIEMQVQAKQNEVNIFKTSDPQRSLIAQQELLMMQQQLNAAKYRADMTSRRGSDWLQLSLVPTIESRLALGLDEAVGYDLVSKNYANELMESLRQHSIDQIRHAMSQITLTTSPSPLNTSTTTTNKSAEVPAAVRTHRGGPVTFGTTRSANPNLRP